jgi:hypothetical protein
MTASADLAPTGRSVQVEGIGILPIAGGGTAGQTTVFYALGLMQRLGPLPDRDPGPTFGEKERLMPGAHFRPGPVAAMNRPNPVL